MITYGSTTLTSYNTITKIEVYYYKSTSAIDLAGGSWSTTKPTWENGKYIWQKIKTTYEGKLENGQFYSESDPVNITGQQGATGTAAYSYKLNASDSVIGKTKTGEYTIDKITFTATYKQGTGAVTAYTGRFKIETTADGTTWTTQYTSSGNESSKEYTIPENIISVRCSLYQSGGTSTLLDITTIPVVKDGIDAVGLRDSIPYYLASDKQTGVTRLDQGWTRFKPELTTEKRYLWVYYVSRYSEGDTQPELIEIKNDIVSFENHGDESPVENCVIDIEPVQDLNGQSSPYPAGGGKNLLYVSTGRTYTENGVTWTLNQNGSVTVSGTATEASTFHYVQQEVGEAFNGDYYFQCFPTISSNIFQGGVKVGGTWFSVYASAKTALTGISGKIQQMWFQVRAGQTLNTTLYPMIYKASETVTEWSPYSNICPISGWTGANIVRTGKNLFDKTKTVRGYINDANGAVLNNSNPNVASDYIPVVPNQSYYIKSEQTKGSWGAWYDKDKNYISGIIGYKDTSPDSAKTKTAPSNAHYMRLTVVYALNGESFGNPDTFSVNYPSTDHDYHPYTGTTYSITFPNEAGTVYGGTLDIVNGKLVVDKILHTITKDANIHTWGVNYQKQGVTGFYLMGNVIYPNDYDNILKNIKCNILPCVNNNWGGSTVGVYYNKGGASTASWYETIAFDNNSLGITNNDTNETAIQKFKTLLEETPLQIVNELATPITYHLTPQEITMLTGQNHIFSDTGQTAISYYDNQTSTDPYVDYSATSAFEYSVKAYEATQPLYTNTYSELIGSANDVAGASFYFAKIHPDSYITNYKVKMKVRVIEPESYAETIDIQFGGYGSTFSSYDAYTTRTGSIGIYYINLYRATKAGIETNYKGHALGIGLRYATNPTNIDYKRTVIVDILELDGCTIEMFDTAVKYADIDGTGSTNYSGITEMAVATVGQNATNNTNTNYTQYANAVKAGVFGVKRYTLLMKDSENTWSSFINQANSTATTKTVCQGGFLLGKLLYSAGGAEYASGANTSTVYDAYPFDFRYSTNCGQTLISHQSIYLVGTIENDGLFHLDVSQWYTQTEPTYADGKVYVYVGMAYSSYQVWLSTENPAYMFYNGEFILYDKAQTLQNINTLKNSLETQIDNKVETWCQKTNPANSWSAEERPNHTGDLWYYIGESTSTYKNNTTYQYNGNTNTWTAYSANPDLFDKIDGKTAIYYGTQSSVTSAEEGDYLVDSTDGSSYRWNNGAWVKVTDYKTAINNIQIGGRNLLCNSNQSLTTVSSKGDFYLSETIPTGTTVIASVQIDADDIVWATTDRCRIGFEISQSSDGIATGTQYVGVWWGKSGTTNNGADINYNTSSTGVTSYHGRIWSKVTLTRPFLADIKRGGIYVQGITSGTYKISNPKVEIATKPSDWTPAPEDVEEEISNLRTDLQSQIDEKIQTYYQSTNPASSWTTAELRAPHDGDLWYYTGTSTSTYTKDNVYRYNASNNTWSVYSASGELFDKVDGKSTIYYGTTSGTYIGVETGDYLVDSTDGSSYRWDGSKWVKVTDYKTTITNAIDDIEIGGRNLLIKKELGIYAGGNITYDTNKVSATETGVSANGLTVNGQIPGWKISGLTGNVNIIVHGITNLPSKAVVLYYTCWNGTTKTKAQANFSQQSVNSDGSFEYKATLEIPSESTHIALGFGQLSASTYELSSLKLEKGNKATDWTPAPEDTQADIDTALAQSVEYIIGTQTAATGNWTGVSSSLTELKDGTQIRYWLPYAGSGNATLNLTLKDGTSTGAIPIYRQGGSYNTTSKVVVANRVTTHFPAGTSISMVYGVNRVVSAVSSGVTYTGTFTGWFADGAYDSGNTYNRTRMQNAITAATAITKYHIICGTASGYKNIGANIAFDLSYPLLYANEDIAATKTGTDNYLQINGISASNNGTITSGGANKTLYLKGTVSGNTFTISASPFMTTVVPTSTDGFYYIPLGLMSSATVIYFNSSNRLYAYIDGAFQPVDIGAILRAQDAKDYATAVYGTCSTGATTVDKVVTCSNFTLFDGARIQITFTNANTAIASETTTASPTLNVNGTGRKPIKIGIEEANTANPLYWAAGATIEFVYDGSAWVLQNAPYTLYGTCDTEENIREKQVVCDGAVVCKGTTIYVDMLYSNTADSNSENGNVTLNVANTIAKTIYANNSTLTIRSRYNWNAGENPSFTFDGQYWQMDKDTVPAYITDKDEDGIFVHPINDTASGWSIGKVFELLNNGYSYIKMWLEDVTDNLSAKIRIGREDQHHILLDKEIIQFKKGDTPEELASFSSSGISFDDGVPFKIGNDSTYVQFVDNDSDGVADALEIVADKISFKNGGDDNTTQDIQERFNDLQTDISNITNSIEINPTADTPYVAITTQDAQNTNINAGLKLEPTQLSFQLNGQTTATMANDEMNIPTASVTNLFMQSANQSYEKIWVMRSNGHLSLKVGKQN